MQLVWSTVVEEQASVLEWADLVNQRYLLVCYLEDVKSVLKVSHVSGCCTPRVRMLHTTCQAVAHTTCQAVAHHVSGCYTPRVRRGDGADGLLWQQQVLHLESGAVIRQVPIPVGTVTSCTCKHDHPGKLTLCHSCRLPSSFVSSVNRIHPCHFYQPLSPLSAFVTAPTPPFADRGALQVHELSAPGHHLPHAAGQRHVCCRLSPSVTLVNV